MKPHVKKFLFHFIISGLLFAFGMYAFDAMDGKDFSFFKFAIRFVIFGLGMAIVQEVATMRKKERN